MANLKSVKEKWNKKFENAAVITKDDIMNYINELGIKFDFEKIEEEFKRLKEVNDKIPVDIKSAVEFAELIYLMILDFIENEELNIEEAKKVVAAYYEIPVKFINDLLFNAQEIVALCEGYTYGLSNIPVLKAEGKTIKRITALNIIKKIFTKIRENIDDEKYVIDNIDYVSEVIYEIVNKNRNMKTVQI